MTSTKTSNVTPAPSKRLGNLLSLLDRLIDWFQLAAALIAFFVGWGEHNGLLSMGPGTLTPLGWSVVLICLSTLLTSFELDRAALRASETSVGIIYIIISILNVVAPFRSFLVLVLLVMNGYQIFWMPVMNWLYKIKTPTHP